MYVTQGTGSAKGTVLGLQGPHSHILLTGEGKGGGGGAEGFFLGLVKF